MARLIPKQKLDEIGHLPERDVARALVDQLSPEVTVFHSQPWLSPNRDEVRDSDYLDQGEADFIILHPNYGILDLEVKGGAIEYVPGERNFFRKLPGGRRRRIKDPFVQGRENLHRITDAINRNAFESGSKVPFVHGYAAIFPDCTYDGPLPPGGEEPRIVLDARHLEDLGKRVTMAFEAWDRRSNSTKGKAQPTEVIEKIRAALLPEFRLKPSLLRSIIRDETELVRLTNKQVDLLKFLKPLKRALVKGVAGSGKTMLAMERASSFAQAGHKTLFLCYNDLLAEVLRDQVPEELENRLVVRHFHAWCRECCMKPQARARGIGFRVPDGADDQKIFWDTTSADLLLKAIPLVSERYDAVVVDEGQDFASDWWYPIEEALADSKAGKALYVFYDPDQNLYARELESPIEGDPFTLDENCRNTKSISRFCKAVTGGTQESPGHAPEGEEPIVLIGNSVQEQICEVEKILDQLLKSDRLESSQIALLVAGGITEYSGFKGLQKIGTHALTTHVNEWKDNKGILLESSKKFKGLEADIVILAGMPAPDSSEYFTKSDLYVSASRGKHRLYLVCRTQDALQYGEKKIKESRHLES
jgi:hypothetical protein